MRQRHDERIPRSGPFERQLPKRSAIAAHLPRANAHGPLDQGVGDTDTGERGEGRRMDADRPRTQRRLLALLEHLDVEPADREHAGEHRADRPPADDDDVTHRAGPS